MTSSVISRATSSSLCCILRTLEVPLRLVEDAACGVGRRARRIRMLSRQAQLCMAIRFPERLGPGLDRALDELDRVELERQGARRGR